MKGKPNVPIATHSEHGWLLSGGLPFKGSHNVTHLCSLHTSLDDNLDELAQNFCHQEEGPPASSFFTKEQACKQQLGYEYSSPCDSK